jgi:hypothetical protein
MDKINLCSGFGVKTIKSKKPTLTIEWKDVQKLVDNPVQDVPKTQAQWLMPSSLLSRSKEEQQQHGEYWLCALDFDKHPPTVPELAKITREILEEQCFECCDFELYNTNSATVDNPKSRLFIPLTQPLNFKEWLLLQQVIAAKFEQRGIVKDGSLETANQVSFLPNGKVGEDVTKEDKVTGTHIVIGERIYSSASERNSGALNPELFREEMNELQRQEDELEAEKAEKAKARSMVKKPTSNDSRNLINAFNQCYDVASLLTAHGYDQRGNRFRHPNSESGSFSASILNGRVNTFSPNDPLYSGGEGARDAFDVFTVLDHGGNLNAALKDAGDNFLTIGGGSWNKVVQREFMQNKAKENVINGFDDIPEPIAKDDEWKAILKGEVLNLNKDYALVLNGSKALVMKTTHDSDGRKERVYLSTKSFDDLFSNRHVKTGVTSRNTDIMKGLGVAWREHYLRADYIDGIVFEPSKYKNGTEIKPNIIGKKLNLWEGFSVEPKQGDLCERLYSHIQNVICCGDHECYDYLLNWIARGFQFPAENGQVAVALKGEKGSGKGTLGKLIKSIYGQHGVQITNPKYLIGNFNAHLQDCCFLFADEAFFAGDKQHENILKSLITEDTMQIERKGIDVETVKNRLKLLMASNNDWIAPATKDERRYFVLDVSSKRIGDTQYFKQLHADIHSDDVKAAFLFDMLARDLSKFHVNRVPETAGLRSQRLQTLDSFGKYWVDVLHRGYLFEKVSANDFVYDFNEWIEDPSVELINAGYQQWATRHKLTKFDILSQTEVGKRLTKWYGAKKRGNVKKIAGSDYQGGAVVTSNRPNYYLLGNLEDATKAFCKFEKIDLTIV